MRCCRVLIAALVSASLFPAPSTVCGNPYGFGEEQPANPSVDDAIALAQQAAALSERAAKMVAEAQSPTAARSRTGVPSQSADQSRQAAASRTATSSRSRQPVAPQEQDLATFVTRSFYDDSVESASDEEPLQPADIPFTPQGEIGPECSEAYGPPPLIWVAGVEASFLWPNLNSEDGAVFEFEDEANESEFSHSSFSDSVDSMYLTPRIWIGVQGCAWGTNLRYWHLRANEGSFDPQLDDSNDWGHADWDWDKTPDTGFFANNRLDAYTIDLELNRRFCIHDCAMQASIGVRHGSIQHHESVVGTALGDESRYISYARSDRDSRGTGFVMGLYGRKPLFPCSCVHWFYNARWSALWGPTCTSAETFAAVMADGSSAGSVNGAASYVDDTLIIGEIQLGLEWNYALRCLPANAFFRAAIEYQRWDGGKGFSESGSFANYTDDDDFTSEISAYTSAAEPQMDLAGITLGTGLTW
jgi:hypothetical protein